jgi:hypothetical protein
MPNHNLRVNGIPAQGLLPGCHRDLDRVQVLWVASLVERSQISESSGGAACQQNRRKQNWQKSLQHKV